MDGAPGNLSRPRKILPDEPGPTFPEPSEHPRLGDENRIDGQPELGGHVVWGSFIEDHLRECLDGRRGETAANLLEKVSQQVLVVFGIPQPAQPAVGVGQFDNDLFKLFVIGGYSPATDRLAIVAETVEGHFAEPVSEGASSLPVKLGQLGDHNHEHFLGDVVGISLGNTRLAEPALDHWPIGFHQPRPRCISVATANSLEKANRRIAHENFHRREDRTRKPEGSFTMAGSQIPADNPQ